MFHDRVHCVYYVDALLLCGHIGNEIHNTATVAILIVVPEV